MSEMEVVKTRLTPGEKEAWQRFCQAADISESDMLREMIQRVCGESIAELGRDMVRGPKSCKLTIRLTQRERYLIAERAEYEGFPNRTRWASALIRATLIREPVLNEREVDALFDASWALNDLIMNMGGSTLASLVPGIRKQSGEQVSIEQLQECARELKERMTGLITGNRRRWNID